MVPRLNLRETTMTTTKAKTSTAAKPTAVAEPRKPSHRLYRVNGEGDAAFWTPIGAAWPNKDGKGFTITCEAVPLTGRIVLRLIEPRAEA